MDDFDLLDNWKIPPTYVDKITASQLSKEVDQWEEQHNEELEQARQNAHDQQGQTENDTSQELPTEERTTQTTREGLTPLEQALLERLDT